MGGNTIIVPRNRVRPVDLSFEDGMKVALSGFVLGEETMGGQGAVKRLKKPEEIAESE